MASRLSSPASMAAMVASPSARSMLRGGEGISSADTFCVANSRHALVLEFGARHVRAGITGDWRPRVCLDAPVRSRWASCMSLHVGRAVVAVLW